jgi:hypothetical protein
MNLKNILLDKAQPGRGITKEQLMLIKMDAMVMLYKALRTEGKSPADVINEFLLDATADYRDMIIFSIIILMSEIEQRLCTITKHPSILEMNLDMIGEYIEAVGEDNEKILTLVNNPDFVQKVVKRKLDLMQKLNGPKLLIPNMKIPKDN